MPEFSQKKREDLAKRGLAMPDGGYPIRNRSDLLNAIKAYGRGTNKPEIKKWIKNRAKELNAEKYLPENWDLDDESNSLSHYGVKGMKWGVRRERDRYNANYTEKQRRQDRAMYGVRAERRINRRMNEGYGIKGARSIEAHRSQRKKRVKQVVGGTLATVGSAWLTDQIFNQGRNTQLVMNFGKRAANVGMNFVNNVVNSRETQQMLNEMLRNSRR